MKKREYILLSAILLIAFTSCDKSMNHTALVAGGDKIDFVTAGADEPFISPLSGRGSETDIAAMRDFGVYAYYAADGAFSTVLTPKFMYNTRVTKNDGVWEYTPVMYWPKSGTVSFFAYSPYADGGNTPIGLGSDITTTGYPRMTYTVPDDVKAQQDLLVSIPLIDQMKADVPAGGKLTLTFKHTLACVVFQAKMTAVCEFPVKVTSVTLGQLKNKAAFTYDDTPGIFSWTATSDAVNKSYTLDIDNRLLANTDISTTASDYLTISLADSHLLLLPQAIDADDEITVTVDYVLAAGIQSKTVTTPLGNLINNLEAGKRYSVNILVSALSDIALTCSVEEWTTETVNVPDFK